MIYPLVQAIAYRDPALIFQCIKNKPYSIFLDSAKSLAKTGRYSFIGIDPFAIIKSKNNFVYLNGELHAVNIFDLLKHLLHQNQFGAHEDLPPFQGGMMGYFGYELCHYLENISFSLDDMQFPDLILGLYDVVFAFDHQLKKAWIFSSGLPEKDETKRLVRAQNRLHYFNEIINYEFVAEFSASPFCARREIISNFTQDTYMKAVRKVIDYIYAGDIFQANISQRFFTKMSAPFSLWQLYQKLRKINPAPFAAYLQLDDIVIASASPERFLQLQDNKVETRPIKGTRPRSLDQNIDQQNALALLNSSKDRAENIMIVDLLRNDLSKVCCDHSVKVSQLCELESYETVHHLTSVIEGMLTKDNDAIELIRATFPGGSISGAPKIRAMQIIHEIEPNLRGPYCGCIGYIGFDGCMDTSITIRTYCIKNNIITFQAGGAIVADSDPYQEYLETMDKAKSLIDALSKQVD